MYIPTKDLLQKYNATYVIECAFQPTSDFCLEIFGLLPNNLHIYTSDANIGVVDAPWLGLIPEKINSSITQHIRKIETSTTAKPNINQITKDLYLKWNLIKGLILGKAIGLHCITGIMLSSDKEKDLHNRYNLEQGSVQELKNKMKPKVHAKTSTNNYHPHSEPYNTNCKTTFLKKTGTYTNISMGISCNNETSKWDIFKSFVPNRIECTIKHCTRYAKYCMIMKMGCNVLHKIMNKLEDTNINFICLMNRLS